ncbi:hypothetical protein DFQ30_011242 [Apophysomyces sp. BC1015]|nr:hypothetical protein DFQ30_011242 [Apophysomyces sp. BC1015]
MENQRKEGSMRAKDQGEVPNMTTAIQAAVEDIPKKVGNRSIVGEYLLELLQMTNFPDYYRLLEVPENATQEQIREAYKKQALLHHPDRLPENATAAQRAQATRTFQIIADAYYILGDRSRREAFDQSRRSQGASAGPATPNSSETQAHHIFGNVFEELLRPESKCISTFEENKTAGPDINKLRPLVENPSHIWRVLGAGAGLVLGFIIGNVGGAAVVSETTVK